MSKLGIRPRSRFREVMRSGRTTATNNLVLKALPGEKGVRVGVVVTKKLGGAVERNRLRRRIKSQLVEIGRLAHVSPVDVIVIARAGSGGLDHPDLASEIRNGMEQLGYAGE